MNKPLSSQLLDLRADLEDAKELLWQYVEQDECVCSEIEWGSSKGKCLFCKAHKYVSA